MAGGSAAIVLKDAADSDANTTVRKLLKEILADPVAGIASVLEPGEFEAGGGFPGAAFVVGLRPGYQLGTKFDGPVVVPRKPGGMHGYLPENPEMRSSLFLAGPGVPKGISLGIVDMRDIAPTLGELLGLKLSTSQGRSLLQKITPGGEAVHTLCR